MTFFVDFWESGFGSLLFPRTGASVEGDVAEWRVVAACLRNGTGASFKRCALRFDDEGAALLWSPRNSVRDHELRVPREHVAGLADEIERALKQYEAEAT